MKTAGVIDIGTNTVLCLKASIAENGINIISDNRFHYRAGKRLDETGNISSEYKVGMKNAVCKALDILTDCSEIKITATEVLRKPKDGAEFASKLSEEIGHHVEIINPQREAELSFKGATWGIETHGETIAVLDVGGGSSELAVGVDGKLKSWSGVKMGAVTACELAGYEQPVDSYKEIADKAFGESDFSELLDPVPDKMLVVGGSAVAVAAILANLDEFQPEKLKDFIILEEVLALLTETLASMTIEQRKKTMIFDPERADIIVSGASILLSFMKIFGFNEIIVSTNGLRHGLFLEHFG